MALMCATNGYGYELLYPFDNLLVTSYGHFRYELEEVPSLAWVKGFH